MKIQLCYLFLICNLLNLTAQEFGTDDFLISHCGGIGDATYNASGPISAYNSTDDNYLLIWYGDDVDFAGIVDNETETFGQLIDSDGSKIGDTFIITSHEGYGNRFLYSGVPSIAYNPINNNFIITYSGVIPVEYVTEVFGVIVSATGVVTTPEFRISEGGIVDDVDFGSTYSKVVYNATDNQYFVVYLTRDETDGSGIVSGQLLDAAGNLIGTNHFPIGNTDTNNLNLGSLYPDVVWNNVENEYYVVWTSLINNTDFVVRAYGQRISNVGQHVGSVTQLSDLVNNPTFNAEADDAVLAYNEADNVYFLTYKDLYNTTDSEIYGQRIDYLGQPVGNKIQLSNQQILTSLSNFTPRDPSVVWDNYTSTYNVVWQGATAFDYESEIYMSKINANGTINTSEFTISDFGVDGDGTSGGLNPSISSNTNRALLISFTGQGDPASNLATLEREVFLQMYGSSLLNVDQFNTIDSSIVFYPNPSKGTFYIKGVGVNNILKTTIFNSLGQQLNCNQVSKSTLVDLEGYATGAYIVSIELKTGQVIKKQLIKL